MRAIALTVMSIALLSCTFEVQRLSLRDPRLPIEALRWLADTEDDVAVARARVYDAKKQLARLESYLERLRDTEVFPKSAGPEAGNANKAFLNYNEERVELKEIELEGAEIALKLAQDRLTQVRAETAMRYDLAAYEMESIVSDVETRKKKVAEIQFDIEEQRATVEKAADALWVTYGHYVGKGKTTDAFWEFGSEGEG